jgi:glycosyltransferase involved in cell wall biosynthesis
VYRLPVTRSQSRGVVSQLFEYLAFFFLALLKLWTLHNKNRYGTIQVHNLPDFLVFAAIMPKMFGARILLDIHDLMPEFFGSRFKVELTHWKVRPVLWQEWLACRFADHVVTVSEHWRELLIRRGVPAHKCSVVMNLADEGIFHQVEKDPLRDQSSSPNFRLVYHGAVVERYGLDLAVKAIGQVRQVVPEINLTILGVGDYSDTLAQMIQDLELSQHVTFYHEIRPAQELPDFISGSNLGIVPYRNDPFTDGLLPTKLLEYAALGIPSIASRTTAIEALFKDTMVEFFTPGDISDLARCILSLYHSHERVNELARGCRKFNEQYNWSKMGREYTSLIEQLNTKPLQPQGQEEETFPTVY